MLSRRGGDLSGGQQQQLAIGRALVTRPRILVLDEPTEGIQPSIIKDIGRAIRYLRDSTGMAILLVEQYLDFCRELADYVYIMDRGEIVHEGLAETLDTPEARRHLTVCSAFAAFKGSRRYPRGWPAPGLRCPSRGTEIACFQSVTGLNENGRANRRHETGME